jgi:hypothetical protein
MSQGRGAVLFLFHLRCRHIRLVISVQMSLISLPDFNGRHKAVLRTAYCITPSMAQIQLSELKHQTTRLNTVRYYATKQALHSRTESTRQTPIFFMLLHLTKLASCAHNVGRFELASHANKTVLIRWHRNCDLAKICQRSWNRGNSELGILIIRMFQHCACWRPEPI